MKKFYKLVSTRALENGYAIELDGRPVKTPGGLVLTAPTKALADEIVAEWSEQGETIIPDSMPVTQILTTAQERIAQDRAAITGNVLGYVNTDLLCYRTGEPERMAKRQGECWDPWLDWFEKRYGARLQTTTALAALKQDAQVHDLIRSDIERLDDLRFCVLQLVTALAGSVVLALAFTHKEASPRDVLAAAYAEEDLKAEIYNEAEHGRAPLEEKKFDAMTRDLHAARIFLDLLEN